MNLKDLLPKYVPLDKPSEYDYKFTVFTPVYNRTDTIHRVFESLEKQTFKNFELIIVNDGSQDNSHEVIEELISQSSLNIKYINNKDNRHKMARIVEAVAIARGEFFLTLDSDDACVENALEVFLERYNSIPKEKLSKISGVTCLCLDQNGLLVGEKFKEAPIYSSSFENRLNKENLSEKWGFTKTDILKSIQVNPDIFSKGWIPEGVLWNLISKQQYKTMYTNDLLRVYYMDTSNSITNEQHESNAFGMAVFSLCLLNWFYSDYFWKNPKIFLARMFALLRSANYLDYKRHDYTNALSDKSLKFIFTIAWPFKKIITLI
ncbi:glycosyltransferase family 2 protein [Xanthomarina sp. F2636L]|uniref:glycosyltransferase family 2 protein n=1 Tax=Xanthomarina sp. F2636L TaxID=2996018 RepID=UPI00225DF613|nr:glycosyltransferase family 2 protein [Xanthomarina sp. F2636L]MCX7549509.1 glycosyltransferase family 2 protein [Xanthomarina sp. F2636L]